MPEANEVVVFEFKRNGNDSGFMAHKSAEYVFKPDRYSAAIIPLEILKKNLRLLVRSKQAMIVRVGGVEAVSVPRNIMYKLFL